MTNQYEKSCISFIAQMNGSYIDKMLELQRLIQKLYTLSELFYNHTEIIPSEEICFDDEIIKNIATELNINLPATFDNEIVYEIERRFSELWKYMHCLHILKSASQIIGVEIPDDIKNFNTDCNGRCQGYHLE